MPIRFRCGHCNQLLGIARRKAGRIVHCPTCRGEVLVPAQETAQVGAGPTGESPALFERDDFDAMLHPVEPPPASPAAPAHDYDVERLPEPRPVPAAAAPAGPGLLLTPAMATVLTVVVIVLLGVAFGTGLLVGKYYLQ